MNERQTDSERNRFSIRVLRYGRVGANIGGVVARMSGRRLLGFDLEHEKDAAALTAALGRLKGPIVKVAQLLATIPEALPAGYSAQLLSLQSHAPPMGWPFVRRRMAAELGVDWEAKFATFEYEAAAAASLGQVHRARSHDGLMLAAKLQYPDMQSTVEADLAQLALLFSASRLMHPAFENSDLLKEIAERLREELDYDLEASHVRLYGLIFKDDALIRVPEVIAGLSTKRLITMTWLSGHPLLDYVDRGLEERRQIARALFRAWWYPFSLYGVVHGDSHLGNYTVFEDNNGRAIGVNLLDYGCVRTIAPKFIQGVIDLYRGLLEGERARVAHAYEACGFRCLTNELIEVLNAWASFVFGPILQNQVSTFTQHASAGAYGNEEASKLHKGLRDIGPIALPSEFVFMNRAAIGLGSALLRLNAELNYHRMFEDIIAGSAFMDLVSRQLAAFSTAGVPLEVTLEGVADTEYDAQSFWGEP